MSVPSAPQLTSEDGTIRPGVNSQSIEVWWVEPTTDGGDPITSYLLSNVENIDLNSPYTLASTDRYAFIGGLSNLSNYTYTIQASNSFGLGDVATFRQIQPGFRPNPTQTVSITSNSLTSVSVSWEAPTSNANVPPPKWYVVSTLSTDPSIVSRSFSSSDSNASYTNASLGEHAYQFLVQAVNDAGYSPYTTVTSTVGFYLPSNAFFNVLPSTYDSNTSNWNDALATNRDLTVYPGLDVPNYTPNAVEFKGSTTFVSDSNDGTLSTWISTFSISAWVKNKQDILIINGTSLLGQGQQGLFQYINYMIIWDTFIDNDYKWKAAFNDNGTTYRGGGFDLPIQQWTHVGITYDSGTTIMTTYINASTIHTNTIGALQTGSDNGPFLLGNGAIKNNPTFRGDIGHAALWNRVLTSNEIYDLYKYSSTQFTNIPSYVVDSNLLLYLDPISYSGSNTWSNSAASNIGTYDADAAPGSSFTKPTSYSVGFNGSNAFFNIPSGFGQQDSYTIQAWFYQTAYPVNGNTAILTDEYISNQLNYSLGFTTTGNVWQALSFDGSTNESLNFPSVNTNEWVNLAMSYDHTISTLTLFVNAVPRIEDTSFLAGVYSGGDTRIGARWDSSTIGDLYEGQMGEILFYNRALSAQEIGSNFGASYGRYFP